MLVAALGFAIMGALVKAAASKFSSAELVFYRSFFGLIAIYMVIVQQRLPLKTPHLNKHLTRSLIGFLSLVLFFYAIAHLPLATAITLNYTSPLFLAILSPLMLHEKPKKILYLTITLGFIGVLLVLQPSVNHQSILAGMIGLGSGLGAAMAYAYVKQLANLNEPDWRTVFYFTLVSTLGAGIWMMVHHFTALTQPDLLLLIGLGLSATIAQLALTRAYRTGKTLTVASLAYMTVVIASLLGVFFWQEKLSLPEWLGIGLIMMAGIISVRHNQKIPLVK